MKYVWLLLISAGCLWQACHSTQSTATITKSAVPDWLQAKIKEMEAAKPHRIYACVMAYSFKGQTVYYIPADCCDQLNVLYNAKGEIICKPDGGFTGKGDGKCPDFNRNELQGKLIWEDPRTVTN